jgi:starch phosphorylase
MLLTEQLVGGVDVWMNNPRRPWEACGTSGMKVLANGGLNLSELDGWWAEAYTPQVGWALGDGSEHGDDPAWDAAEAEELYTLLEKEVVPQFYTRDAHGLPIQWLMKVRKSIETLTARFSANRTVRQYTEEYYVTMAAAYRRRSEINSTLAIQMLTWHKALVEGWKKITFGEVQVETHAGQHHFKVQVDLGGIHPDAVCVELYADGLDGDPFRQTMTYTEKSLERKWRYFYTAEVPATRPASDFTPRILPKFSGMAVPLEMNLILWQH